MIWERAPKIRYCGIDKLEFAVYDSIANFNYGRQATLDIYKQLNLDYGVYTSKLCLRLNIKRKYNAGYKNMQSSKKQRKIIRSNKKKKTILLQRKKVKHTNLVDFKINIIASCFKTAIFIATHL